MIGHKKYDLVFGIGAACSCTQILRNANLQHQSNPLDWLFGATFEGRVNLLVNEFENFINKEDLEFAGQRENPEPCDIYQNKANDIVFNHDFPLNMSLEKSYPIIKEKYDRRIKRLLNGINVAQNVLIVYIETPNSGQNIENDVLLNSYKQISGKYNTKNITLLYFACDTNIPKLQEEFISNNVIKVIGDYKNKKVGAVDYAVDTHILNKYMNKYKLNLPLSFFVKKKILGFVISLIPIKKYRKQLRSKYHV